MDKIKEFLLKIWNLIPAVLGLLESLLPVLKEVCVIVARLVAILPIFWADPQPAITKIDEIFESVVAWVEKVKNAILFT